MCYLCIKILPIEKSVEQYTNTQTYKPEVYTDDFRSHAHTHTQSHNTIQMPGFVILADAKLVQKKHTHNNVERNLWLGFHENIIVRTKDERKRITTE